MKYKLVCKINIEQTLIKPAKKNIKLDFVQLNWYNIMNKTCEYIAYLGNAFTIEWYFDPSDKSEALEYYNSLNANERIQLLKLFKRMGDVGEIKDITKFRNEGDKIYAFKPQPDRFLCFFNEGKKIIVTNGFRKKQPKLPVNEKENALSKREEYLNRVKLGEYYD